ncbi:hypothetical protein OS187_07900 [Xanthomonadaceae bacterium JHOS43]|nr:hypothetical protein [Xanthomonadaceae bacterium JHOS43]MCX7564358.1 hypothetical protein [Xanthomonadaceae bacterium XH05]
MSRIAFSVIAVAAFALGSQAVAQQRADTLLVERAAASKSLVGPTRGSSMSQVEASFGAPEQKLEPRGGQQPQWPVIHRWVYPEFIVFFEKSHVIDVVARQATPGEIGPKPAR